MLRDPVLVLVDLQNDFGTPGFAHDPDEAAVGPAIEAAAELLSRYRDSGRTPVFVRTIHDDASTVGEWAEKYADRPVPCRPGSEGAAFVPAIDVHEDDVVVTKRRYSGFFGTPLDAILASNGVGRLLIGGISTNVCVESTVRAAYDRNYEVTVLADCTASTEPALREASLRNVAAHFGTVADSDEVTLEAATA